LKKYHHQEFYYTIQTNSGLNELDSEKSNPDLKTFLEKIISALKLEEPGKYLIISCKSEFNYPLRQLLTNSFRRLISFGITANQFELQGFDKIHHVYALQSDKLLLAQSLQSYSDQNSKNSLWHSLKEMFEL
jgi:hypothetical protein